VSGAPAEVGSTANNYQILARLAVGGMAEIFLARGVSAADVERYCVLKRILRNRASDLHFVRMFLDEARLAAQLNHPNVAQVYDIGKLADSYFFTMEYVHGETVRAVLQRARSLRRELPLGPILTVIAGAAAGLHHAHERLGFDGRPLGIVHRDVSPSNLMVSYEGGVKLVDFGVAKAADRMQETRSGTVKGKISYLSPEQCRGAEVDRRSDLFALGIVMWEMVTGERLYRRASDFENMNAIVNEPPPAPSTRRRSLPPELDALVMRLLAKHPNERYQTADDVVDALEQVAVATGAMISSSSLGRLVREMFGQRPEPWLEMDPQEAPEGVTVTSEPIPSELGAALPDAMDLQLAGVPDLSSQRVLTQDEAVPLPVPASWSSRQQRLTAPLRAPRPPGSESSGPVELAPPLPPPPPAQPIDPMAATQPGALPLPAPPVTLPEIPPNRAYPVSTPGAPALVGQVPESMPVPGSGGHVLPSSGRHALPGSAGHALPGSAGHALPAAAAVVQLGVEEPAERPARGWPMIAVILAAMVIGSLTVLLVMKTGGGASSPDMTGRATPPEPAGAAAGPIVTPIAGEAGAPPEDAQAVALAAEADAAPAAPAAAAAPDAAAPDAAVADAAAPDAAVAAADPPKTALEGAMDDRRYADAVAICGKRITAATAAMCTLAACHARVEAKARAWFQRTAPGKRQPLIGLCRSLGIDPAPPRRPPPRRPDAGVDKCEANPMACQH
jgi:serine/threonine protein kinase